MRFEVIAVANLMILAAYICTYTKDVIVMQLYMQYIGGLNILDIRRMVI